MEVIGGVEADALRDAIKDMIDHYDAFDEDGDSDVTLRQVNLSDDPYEYFDRDFSPCLPAHLELEGDELTVVVRTELEVDENDELGWLDRILQPLAERLGVHVVAEQDHDSWPGRAYVRVTPPLGGLTVKGLLEQADPFKMLAEAVSGTGLSPATAADLLRGGHPQTLLGQPESQWLEVKGQPPRTANHADNLDFAKYVAAFCNADIGGLVVYGLQTTKHASGDIIDRIRPFLPGQMTPRQLLMIVRDRVHPYPLGIKIEVVEIGQGRCLGLVEIPAQSETRKPFLLRGATIEGRVHNTYVGIPTRAGEDVIWDDVAGIHSLLLAGRVALTRPGQSGSSRA